MLIKINKHPYEKDMKRITLFAYKILCFAAHGNSYDENKFLKRFGKETGQWFLKLSRKNKNGQYSEGSVISGMEGLFVHNIKERKQMKKAFKNDVRYARHINDTHYQFMTPCLPDSVRKTMEKFLVPFYEVILERTKGFELQWLEIKNFSKTHVRSGFDSVNKETIRICPICLGHIQKDKKKNYVYYKIDHYFPKSKYPVFSVFADNLVPVCETCNGPNCKHEKDPLEKQHGPGCLLKIYIPYYREVQGNIRLEFTNDEVHILPVDKSDKYAEVRIKNLDRIYNLGSRWSAELDDSFISISERIKKEVEWKVDLLTDDSKFIAEIEHVAVSFMHNKGMAFLIAEYLKWISENKKAAKAARLSSINSISELKQALK